MRSTVLASAHPAARSTLKTSAGRAPDTPSARDIPSVVVSLLFTSQAPERTWWCSACLLTAVSTACSLSTSATIRKMLMPKAECSSPGNPQPVGRFDRVGATSGLSVGGAKVHPRPRQSIPTPAVSGRSWQAGDAPRGLSRLPPAEPRRPPVPSLVLDLGDEPVPLRDAGLCRTSGG